MAIRFPNIAYQTATFETGSPNYIDCSAGAALPEFVLFSDAGLDDGDKMSIRIRKSETAQKIWVAEWVAATERLNLETEEYTVGTWSDADVVGVNAVLSEEIIFRGFTVPQLMQPVVVTEDTTLTVAHSGYTIFVNSSSAVVLTIEDTVPVNFQCMVFREGTGTVAIARDGSDTINGGTSNVAISAQYRSAYVCQRVEGNILVSAG